MDANYLFIINPNSGKRNAPAVIQLIREVFGTKHQYSIKEWKCIDDFNNLRSIISDKSFTHIVAVGGDGSVNLVGSTLLNTDKIMGILPTGSGNGLARSLGISMDLKTALSQLTKGNTRKIDSGTVNGKSFFCTSGTGFDAHIGKLFAGLKTRGLKMYVKLIIQEFFSYKPKIYSITIDGKQFSKTAFFITVGNAGQFGNNFYIAPDAKLNDGLLNIVVLKPFSIFSSVGLLMRILMKKTSQSRFIETYTGKEIIIERETPDSIHCDGEPDMQESRLNYNILPNSLQVIIGDKFDGI